MYIYAVFVSVVDVALLCISFQTGIYGGLTCPFLLYVNSI